MAGIDSTKYVPSSAELTYRKIDSTIQAQRMARITGAVEDNVKQNQPDALDKLMKPINNLVGEAFGFFKTPTPTDNSHGMAHYQKELKRIQSEHPSNVIH